MSQPAIYVASLAALEKLKKEQPDVVEAATVAAGLSLGEYTALVFAGALGFEDGLKLVCTHLCMHALSSILWSTVPASAAWPAMCCKARDTGGGGGGGGGNHFCCMRTQAEV